MRTVIRHQITTSTGWHGYHLLLTWYSLDGLGRAASSVIGKTLNNTTLPGETRARQRGARRNVSRKQSSKATTLKEMSAICMCHAVWSYGRVWSRARLFGIYDGGSVHGDHKAWNELQKGKSLEHNKEVQVALHLGFGVDFGANRSRAMEKGIGMLTLADSQGLFFAKINSTRIQPYSIVKYHEMKYIFSY